MLGEENLGEFSESLEVQKILPSKFKNVSWHKESKHRNSQKFYLPKVSDEKFAKVFFH